MASTRYAIAYTVKNEARILPSAIEYHLAAGCSRIYIFWDGTTDESRSLVARYPVIARNSYLPEELKDPPAWMTRILPWWEPVMDVRKQINTYYAALDAASNGVEWLAGLDPDELILMSPSEAIDKEHVTSRLETVPPEIDQVLMPNLESVTTIPAATGNPFCDCIHFLNRFPVTEVFWRYSRALLRRAHLPFALLAWYDYAFYNARFLGALPRMMREPRNLRRIPAGYFLAYDNHKSFIRTERCKDFEFAIHAWKKYLRRPRNLRLGNVLHYDLPDYQYFSAKFRQRRPESIIKQFYFRYRLAEVARNYSESEVEQFFEDYIAIRQPAVVERLRRKGILLEIRGVSDLMKRLQCAERTPSEI